MFHKCLHSIIFKIHYRPSFFYFSVARIFVLFLSHSRRNVFNFKLLTSISKVSYDSLILPKTFPTQHLPAQS